MKNVLELLQRLGDNTIALMAISVESKLRTSGGVRRSLVIFQHEAIMWNQRAKVSWFTEGDRNTKYFHSFAAQRRKNNFIAGLFDGNEIWRSKREEVALIMYEHFAEAYDSARPDEGDIRRVIDLIQPTVTEEVNRDLCRSFSAQDVTEVLKQMGPFKSPGPDGLNATFFQKLWPTVGASVTQSVLQILHGGQVPDLYNHTNVVLLPKVKEPKVPSDFHPISLCNVIMKLVSKCIVNRLRSWLPSIISSNQSGFIAGRSIFDNAAVAFELFLEVLDWYKAAAGQEINFAKSRILFSKNVEDERRGDIKQYLGVSQPLENNKYLSLPVMLGRNKNVSFEFLRDRKYFPRTSFIHAKLANNPSALWRGLIEARNILIRGGLWRIGDGLEANMFFDKWLSLIPDDLLHDHFSESQVAAIQAIPLVSGSHRDQWIWDHNVSGVYIVKSDYYVAKQFLNHSSSTLINAPSFDHWNTIWQLELMPKLKLFAWKLGQGIVSTRDNLIHRGLQHIPAHCEVCLEPTESILHLFRDCRWTRQFWLQLGMSPTLLSQHFDARLWLQEAAVGGFHRWLLNCSTLEAALEPWPNPGLVTSQDRWIPPEPGMFKINFDAAFVLRSTTNRFGMAVRDHCGRCIGTWSGWLGRQGSALQAEAVAALKCIDLARDMNLGNISLEGDCEVLIKELCTSSTSFSLIGHLTKTIRDKASSSFASCRFSFVKRGGNRPAHALAHYVSLVNLISFRCNNLPHTVAEFVRSDRDFI
ncbi:uncharacterized protein [Rutidosis leptorrhynchoides]|uniref:uncharacterized protein n=1 Tax=Rutidosis leptorrhynchoides TaxID=125765 RepID=UPI003A9A3B51